MPTNLTIDYDATPAEIEAGTDVLVPAGGLPVHATSQPKPKSGSPLFAWLLFIGLTVMFFLLMSGNADRGSRGSGSAGGGRSRTQEPRSVAGVCLIAAGATVVLGFALMAVGVRIPPRTPKQSFAFTDDGVTQYTDGHWQYWPWPALHSFAETETLFVLRHLPQEGFVFPKRLFATPEDADAFRALATARLSKPVQTPSGLEYAPK
jgi:hypothetical protein